MTTDLSQQTVYRAMLITLMNIIQTILHMLSQVD